MFNNMGTSSANHPPAEHQLATALFLPTGRFRAGVTSSESFYGGFTPAMSASDLPAYTTTPTDTEDTFRGTRPLTEKEVKKGKEVDIDEAAALTKVELF